ncbi:MAG TPA: pyridoxal-phosphate dependent enzyme [Flavisolibacter sp.]|jgi:1-aminocyclopropane-1-carboxylate deaminase/D-cysteine desulfhydrase-like pyridoxal-dependent ACC family enzyme|nr:pyridoxal-phosphate dependent enzyme [Flavisolibacter sp.]
MMLHLPIVNCRIDTVPFYKFHTTIDVLRLDRIDPVISGNKWFKLKGYLAQAFATGKKGILTFGGAYSNHLLATASACNRAGLKSIGIIRGERPAVLSPTLQQAQSYGMQIHFISRAEYAEKKLPAALIEDADYLRVPEGGYGVPGMEGAKDILAGTNRESYTHILAAIGTGTMLAGLAAAALPNQEVWGVNVLKNHRSHREDINELLKGEEHAPFQIIESYHFGGYAKHTAELIRFMNDWYRQTGIPSDFVYTGKLFFAVADLLATQQLPGNSRLLVVHSGGLQGNASLPQGTLIF